MDVSRAECHTVNLDEALELRRIAPGDLLVLEDRVLLQYAVQGG